ncbi:hypothetical protein [Sphingomonas radiodurans]|uniref:hypothetical protein n=1 Tax=Sphingomonas radiodurans TaxID=2890321 RepID=UPI001E36A3AF|nr:hypothetical protein [Sphingomonas radiodurans]WBH15306.1 hypothetical protein LLW23_10660 [Sphingomonas radiodurans]
MSALAISMMLAGAAIALTFGYLFCTPTQELLRGAGPEFRPTFLDQALPGWRRAAGAAGFLVFALLIALGFWISAPF